MTSRKPLGERNEIVTNQQRDGSPERKKHESTNLFETNGRTFSADSGFVSPETICRPKLTASRRSSPAGAQPFTSSIRLEDSPDSSCHVADSELPSRAIADLWNKPLKLVAGQISTKTPRAHKLCSEGSNTPNRCWNDLPPTKLSFDSCESSGDETSPRPLANARKGVGYRRSLSYTESESSKKETFRLLTGEATPVFNPKRHKFQDEASPYKTYAETVSVSKSSTQSSEDSFTDSLGGDEDLDSVSDLGKPAGSSSTLTPEVKRLCFTRSQSESALAPSCNIKQALERIDGNPNLIGDFSKSYALPVKLDGKHADLKEVTSETLADLLEGKLHDRVTSFKVIDCRYPYEYEAGHIKGAINLFTKKQIYEEFIQPKLLSVQGALTDERNILIFHCEFSSQRGPEMCRFLRDSDRASNLSMYPRLYYPELYVLFGGYKEFFNSFPTLCNPQTYLRMDDPNHSEECRHFKSRTKLEIPETSHRSKKSKSQNKFSRVSSFPKKCNF